MILPPKAEPTREERQVRAVQRRMFESAHKWDVDTLQEMTKLSREVIIDALMLVQFLKLPQVVVHAAWTDWTKAMAFTGSSEYRTFAAFMRDRAKELEASHGTAGG